MGGGSLSARRAWIEIFFRSANFYALAVALRKESVDRNFGGAGRNELKLWSLSARRAWIEIQGIHAHFRFRMSLSARRAWIEIVCATAHAGNGRVALRKESVDRNIW